MYACHIYLLQGNLSSKDRFSQHKTDHRDIRSCTVNYYLPLSSGFPHRALSLVIMRASLDTKTHMHQHTHIHYSKNRVQTTHTIHHTHTLHTAHLISHPPPILLMWLSLSDEESKALCKLSLGACQGHVMFSDYDELHR
jgi:hypothetical protein